MNVLLGPAHLGNVNESFDAWLKFDERTVVGNVRHRALKSGTERILGIDVLPRIILQLLHAQADALRIRIDANDLHFDGVADSDDFGRVVDAAPGHVGDVEQAIDATEIDECAVIGNVLDHTVDDLTFGQTGHNVGALLGPGFLQHGPPRHNDVTAPAIHLQNLERLLLVHQWSDVADRADVDLAAGKKCNGAIEIDREAALDLGENDPGDFLAGLELLLQADPAFFATGLIATENGFANSVFNTLKINLNFVSDVQVGTLAGNSKFFQRDPALHFQADIDDGQILFDRNESCREPRYPRRQHRQPAFRPAWP